MKLNMGEEEILISYRQAKNPKEQVQVLADLNGVERTEMARWLADHGQRVDGRLLPKPKEQESQPDDPFALTDGEPDAENLYEKLIEKLDAIPKEASIKKPAEGCLLTKEEAYSVANLIDMALFDAIRNDVEADSMKWLVNVARAYEKMCEASGYVGVTE